MLKIRFHGRGAGLDGFSAGNRFHQSL